MIDKFYGVWTFKNEQDMYLKLQDGIELIGVMEAQLMTRAEFTITELNMKEQSIVIEGYSEDISYEEKAEKEVFTSKLYLKNEGKGLLYINDYLGEKVESEWIR